VNSEPVSGFSTGVSSVKSVESAPNGKDMELRNNVTSLPFYFSASYLPGIQASRLLFEFVQFGPRPRENLICVYPCKSVSQ